MSALKIGELAGRFNVPVETIRYYEQAGLLPKPARTAGNYRLYSEADADNLAFVLNCRMLDMRQEEIKVLLALRATPNNDCGDVNLLVDRHIADVTQRIDALKRLLKELTALRRACTEKHVVRDCAVLARLQRPEDQKLRRRARVS